MPRSPISAYSNISSPLDELSPANRRNIALSWTYHSTTRIFRVTNCVQQNQPCTHVLRLTRRTAMGLASGQALVLRRRINRICSVFWTLTVAPTLSSSSLASSTIRKAAALHIHIYYFFLFFFWVGRASERTFPHVVILTAALSPSIHIIITYSSMHIYVFLIYICIHTIIYYFRTYIYMNTLLHARSHTYTHIHHITIYVYSYIFTHNYTYII